MIIYDLRLQCARRSPFRCGASVAQRDLAELIPLVSSAGVADVILNFEGIEAVNGSYVRASVAWLLRCAMVSRCEGTSASRDVDPWAIRSLGLQRIFVKNLSDDVREEIDGLLSQPAFKLPCLEAVEVSKSGQIHSALLLGHLDRQLEACLRRLYEAGGSGKAIDLHEKHPGEGVQITAWNNRLAALYERLLLDRNKEGRFWIYKTITKNLETHGLPLET